MAEPILYLARVAIETLSPLSLRTGADASSDLNIATDANGLPVLPGTVLAGACQRVSAQRTTACAVPAFTWGHIHDSRNVPVDGLDSERHWQRDPLLAAFFLRDLPRRGHIRLGDRSSALQRARSERPALPPGHRFTFEMALRGPDGPELAACWEDWKAALASEDLRLGGAASAGCGRIRVERHAEARFDLRVAADFHAHARHPRRLDQPSAILRERPPAARTGGQGWLRLELLLAAEDFWRCGGGDTPLLHCGGMGDALPYTGERILWAGGQGRIVRHRVVLPASAIKGALAHRTAFHFNRLTGGGEGDGNPAVRHLFGHVDAAGGSAQAGGLRIDDVAIDDPVPARLIHNSLDRFTGGVREGVLFTEEALFGQSLPVHLRMARPTWETATQSIRRAFRAAVDDLLQGRLSLGAAGSRGLGYFEGRVVRDELGETSP